MPDSNNPLSSALEGKRIVRLSKAAELRGESVDSTRRHLRGKEVQLGPRNIGFRVEDVLQLKPPKPPAGR